MASPKTVGRFYVETSRQTINDAASAQHAGRRYLDALIDASRAYYASWTSAQQSAMQTAFQMQNAAIEASGSVLDATTQASRALFEECVKAATDDQIAFSNVAAASVSLIEDTIPGSRI